MVGGLLARCSPPAGMVVAVQHRRTCSSIGSTTCSRSALARPQPQLLGRRQRQLGRGTTAVGPSRRSVPMPALGTRSLWEAQADFDPDTYEEEMEDDDDYQEGELLDLLGDGVTAVPATAVAANAEETTGIGSTSSTSSRNREDVSSSSSSSGGFAVDGAEQALPPPRPRRRERSAREALSHSYGLMLLFWSSTNRLLSRLRTAVLATVRVTWQLAGEALQTLHHSTVQAKSQAEEAFAASPAGKKVQRWQQKMEAAQQELPEDLWGKVMWMWDRPHMQKLRLTVSMANFSIRLPALVALVATQIGLLSTSLSLPMLAPLLLGTGMLMRSIRTNASLVFPRIGLLVVLLWLLWFANSVIQNTVAYLRKQGAIDQRMANNINSAAELTVLVTAGVILLSMLGVNVSALLLPAGVVAAIASRDLSLNFLAGFFLMMVQPFRLGDRVGVTLPSGPPGGFGAGGAWFEGVCEKVDLRYTSLRQGKRRLMVPNSAFLQQPFMILEDVPQGGGPGEAGPGPGSAAAAAAAAAYPEPYVWQSYMNGAPFHREAAAGLAAEGPAAQVPTRTPGAPPPPVYVQPAQQPAQQQQAGQPPPKAGQQPQPLQQPTSQQAAAQQQQQYPQQQYQAPQLHYQQAFEYRNGAPMGAAMNGWMHTGHPGMPLPPMYPGGPPPGGHPLPPNSFL